MVEIVTGVDSTDHSVSDLEILYQEGLRLKVATVPLVPNWNVSLIDKIMDRLDHDEIIEFLGNKPNPHRKGPPADPPAVIVEYLDRLKVILDRRKTLESK